jgi:protein-tyrosine phosphatase
VGGIRSKLRHAGWQIGLKLGRFDYLKAVEFSRVRRLVFICKGNICRSPYAEVRARMLGAQTVSGGLEAAGDKPANDTAIHVSRGRGVDLTKHVSQNVSSMKFDTSDLIVVMEPSHLRGAAELATRSGAQHTLAGLWCSSPRVAIEDPYGRSASQFSDCFTQLDAAIENLVTQSRANTGKSCQ